jgi:YHS domain-containing protein
MNFLKNYIKIIASVILLTSCNQSKPQPELKPIPKPKQVSASAIQVDISNFATPNDTTCGMPLTAGIADTVTVKGKLYGFCSSSCKEEFLAFQSKQ